MRYAIASLVTLIATTTFSLAAQANQIRMEISMPDQENTVVRGADDAPTGTVCFYQHGLFRLTDFEARIFGTDHFNPNYPIMPNITVEDHLMQCSIYHEGTMLDGPVPVTTGGHIDFQPNFDIPMIEELVCLDIQCDLANVGVESGDADTYGIMINGPARFEFERQVNGDALHNSRVHLVHMKNGRLGDLSNRLVVEEHGNLTVAFNGPAAGDLEQGSTDNHVASFDICADDLEEFWSYELNLLVDQSQLFADFLTITHEDEDGNLVMDTEFIVDGMAQFHNTDIYVDQNSCTTIDVYVDVHYWAPLGAQIWIGLDTNDLEFHGMISGQIVTEAVPYTTIVSNTFTVVESQP